jgi:hypothetical protein
VSAWASGKERGLDPVSIILYLVLEGREVTPEVIADCVSATVLRTARLWATVGRQATKTEMGSIATELLMLGMTFAQQLLPRDELVAVIGVVESYLRELAVERTDEVH